MRPKPAGRFDLIPPGSERRIAQIFERDAALYGKRDYESGTISLSELLNIARDALNRLHARDVSEDHAARACWAMLAYMDVEARVQAGRLPIAVADMPMPDPIMLNGVVQAPALSAPAAPEPPTPPSPPMLPGK